MSTLLIASFTAFWLGILTSISPCPLATNIAAVSYVGRHITRPYKVFLSGFLYTSGRMIVYMGLGIILVKSLLATPTVSFFLQTYMNKILGPLLIIVGMILVELIRFDLPGFGAGKRLERWVDTLGYGGAFLLGIVFALSFCPVSAALFFGSLVPLAVSSQSDLVVPAVYGVATGLPVMAFAFLAAVGVRQVTPIFNGVKKYERWVRFLIGIVFILVGIYYSLIYIFGIAGA